MGTIVITCPNTKKEVSTGIAMNQSSFDSSRLVNNKVSCPHCNAVHVWNKEDARLKV